MVRPMNMLPELSAGVAYRHLNGEIFSTGG
jgi:hypothetical protein